MLWTPGLAHAQPTISITNLLQQGFTNSALPYSLLVTGIKGVGVIGARFDDIYLDGGQMKAHGGFLSFYGCNDDIKSATVNTNTGKLTFSGAMTLPKWLQKILEKKLPAVPKAEPVLIADLNGVAFEGGTFTLPSPPYTFYIGRLTLENVSFTIDTDRKSTRTHYS